MPEQSYRVRTPLFPLYSEVRKVLIIWEGVKKASVLNMIKAIWEQTGTPQDPVDWTDPNRWISTRLSNENKDLATRIWNESESTVNPRHVYGAYLFINTFALLVIDSSGVYCLTERGRSFLEGDKSTVRNIDEEEGMGELISILATKTRAKFGELIPDWEDYLKEYSKFGTTSTIKDTLRRRLRNLLERDFVRRDGNIYNITEDGLKYLDAFEQIESDPKRDLIKTIKSYNDKHREHLKGKLHEMHPIDFEGLVSDLLEAMGYEDVTVTKQSGDKGVDVVGTVQSGITTVTEVVQVKRQKNNIGRPILDMLRGALPYHSAIRGTLIILSNFSKGCEEAALFQGATPITLINGEKLLDLLIEHEIGVDKKNVYLNEVDDEYFRAISQQRLDQPDMAEE